MKLASTGTGTKLGLMPVIGIVCIISGATLFAQVQTTQTTAAGTAKVEVNVERGEVVTVEGNDLIVKMEDGTIRHFPNIPDRAKITVDGKQLSIHDLKPGMKLERTITTTTTPMTVTTVQTVTGKVWQVTPPLSVILTMENNENKVFKIPNGQKFEVDGQMVDAFGLKKGMRVTATKITEVPETVVTQQKSVTGTIPIPPETAILIAEEISTAAPPSAAATPAQAPTPEVPNTGTNTWLILVVILVLLMSWWVARYIRTKSRRA
ncbi:MAG TPA: hypothetical protein VMJ35_13850 [Dongiaceae bacterium]|nr:hypothetical protein [Dongiaceae bacterium]